MRDGGGAGGRRPARRGIFPFPIPHSPVPPSVNNAFYDSLGDLWFEGDGHAIALLRAEGRLKTAYVHEVLDRHGLAGGADVLDAACGGGLVAHPLAAAGHRVLGVDLAPGAVEAAARRAPPGADVRFVVADAAALPADDASVDAVLLLDMLEHVESTPAVLAEAARVLRPGGVVVFNTFSRTPLAWLVAIHGFTFVVRDAPEHIHVYRLFQSPETLSARCANAGLDVQEVRGVRPRLNRAFWRSVARRRVDPGFAFAFTGSTAVGYMGHAVKRAQP